MMVSFGILGILFFLSVAGPCQGLQSTAVKMSIAEAGNDSCLDHPGQVCGCDGGPAKDITVTWKPEKIAPSGSVTVSIDFTLDHDLNDGYLNASAFFHGEKKPFIGYGTYFTCKDFIKYLPFGSCPLKKGFHLHTSKKFDDLHDLTSYPGDYDGEIQVYVKDGDSLKEIICVKAHVVIEEV